MQYARKNLRFSSIPVAVALVLSCQPNKPQPVEEGAVPMAKDINRAVCMLYPTEGNEVKGMVCLLYTSPSPRD